LNPKHESKVKRDEPQIPYFNDTCITNASYVDDYTVKLYKEDPNYTLMKQISQELIRTLQVAKSRHTLEAEEEISKRNIILNKDE
jgi:hypothetical protein